MLSFHSLRSGFICSAIAVAGSDNNTLVGVLEHCAFVAGWKPGQRAQLRYVKECQTQTVVASRLLHLGGMLNMMY
jgi:hypothetical protein